MPSILNATTTTGLVSSADNSGSLQLQTNNGTTAVTIDTSQNVGVGSASSGNKFEVAGSGMFSGAVTTNTTGTHISYQSSNSQIGAWGPDTSTNGTLVFFSARSNGVNGLERMRIDSSGNLLVGKTSPTSATIGCEMRGNGIMTCTRASGPPLSVNRTVDDGDLVSFQQDGTQEGSISVSGTTVSYNGGHLSRWSQWQNQTGKPDVYRGTVLESTNDMCEWNQPNEQATKTIVSSTVKSKAVAGVFDMYDENDEDNPYDFYVAQSGDFVIRIAQGVVVENGDLLESAGDGTARPQTDDICRSSTIAKVTSNYVSVTYADGSYCVPCILMIG